MKIKSQKDFWSGLLFIALGVAFAWGALNYRFGDSAEPGPGYFPFGLGALLALLGALVLFKSLMLETEGGERIGRFAWRPLVVVLAAVALFGWLLPRAGLGLALPATAFVAAFASDEFRLREALATAVVLTVGCWLVFVVGLELRLPVWPWT